MLDHSVQTNSYLFILSFFLPSEGVPPGTEVRAGEMTALLRLSPWGEMISIPIPDHFSIFFISLEDIFGDEPVDGLFDVFGLRDKDPYHLDSVFDQGLEIKHFLGLHDFGYIGINYDLPVFAQIVRVK